MKDTIMYCYSTVVQGGVYTSRKEEFEYSFLQDNVCYYDRSSDIFYDNRGLEVDIRNRRILTRAHIQYDQEIIEAILRKGGIPINSLADIERIKNWRREIRTERISFIATGRDLLENEEVRTKIVEMSPSGEFFLKTKDKDFSDLVSIAELYEYDLGLLPALELHKDDEFIVSEKVQILKDDLGNLEYRCFIVDGRLLSISRMLFLTEHRIPAQVLEHVNRILKRIKENSTFPTTFTLDIMFCLLPDKNIILSDIIELNPLEASGEYLYNSIWENSMVGVGSSQEILPSVDNNIVLMVPLYKRQKDISYEKNEPARVMKQFYHHDGFSYHYGCAKNFGKVDMPHFKEHYYCGMDGSSFWIDIVDILNNHCRLKDALPYIGHFLIEEGIDINSLEFQKIVERNDMMYQKKLIRK